MKWLLLILSLLPSTLRADDTTPGRLKSWSPQFQNKFCGLDTLHESSLLDDCDAQSLQNVLTDRGYLEERTGMIRLFSPILSGFPVKQVYEYVGLSNTRYIIAHASNTIYETNLANTPLALSTAASGQNVECAVLSGDLVCDDGAGAMWDWNETSTTTVNGGAPICNLLATEYGRMFCGAPTTDLSQVAVSSYPGFGYWIPSTLVPLPANSATTFEFNPNDGDSIQCMRTTPWGLFVGKRNSSYILKGYDNTSFFVQTIDPSIGCVDQRTFQMVNGLATWMSQKGVYQWPGWGPPIWISEKIDPTYRGIRQLSSNSNFWEMQSQANWQAGSFTTNGPKLTWDATSFPGYILPSSSSFQDNTTSAFSSGTIFTNIDTVTIANSIQLSSFTAQDNWSNNITAGHLSWVFTAGGWATNSLSNGINIYGNIQPADLGNAIATSSVAYSSGSWSWDHQWISGGGSECGAHKCFEFRFKKQDANNYYAAVYNLDTAPSGQLIKTVSGTKTILSNGIGDLTGAANKITHWQVISSTEGKRMTLYVDGIFVGSTTDTSLSGPYTATEIATGDSQGGLNIANYFANFNYYDYYSQGTFQSRIFDTQFSTPTYGILNATTTVATDPTEFAVSFYTRVSTSPNNDFWDSYSASSDTIAIGSAQKRYTQYEAILTTLISTKTINIPGVGYYSVSTGIYYSPVDFIGTKITGWKQINIQDYQQTNGEFQYYVRTATYSFSPTQVGLGSSGLSTDWTNQKNNQMISIETGTYFQWKVDSSSITSSSQAVTLANASIARSIVNWQEGTSAKPASGFMDQRYFLCVTLSTSDTTNDGCLIFQRNRNWTLLNGPSISAMSTFNFQLAGGDGSSNSKVWYMMQDGVYDDDGVSINSFWTSKDFIVGSPFFQKTFYEVWTDNQYSQGSSLNVGWSLDKNPIFTSKNIALDNSGNTTTQTNANTLITRTFPNGTSNYGKYIRFNFNQNLLDLPWRLNDYLFYVDVEGRQTQ